jgi:hypothetical protein
MSLADENVSNCLVQIPYNVLHELGPQHAKLEVNNIYIQNYTMFLSYKRRTSQNPLAEDPVPPTVKHIWTLLVARKKKK